MSEGIPTAIGTTPQSAAVAVPNPKTAKPRMVGLDVMRFIAVMMVLYAHANLFPPTRKFFMAKIGPLYDALYELRLGCWVAVDMFFVLSGFLISGLLFQELKRTGTISIGRFLIRRGFKIYPVFWLMLLVTVIGKLWMGEGVSLKTLFTELLFVQNYRVGPPPSYGGSFWGITWSLGVEEHFYFMMAGLAWFVKRKAGPELSAKIHALPKLFLCVAAGCLTARLITCLTLPYYAQYKIFFLQSTHARMDALFFGVLISYYWNVRWDDAFKARLMDKRWIFAIAGLALMFPAIYEDEEWFRIFGFVFTYMGAGYLMVSLLSLDRSPSGVAIRGMAWLGRHSYSVYLWHIMAGSWWLPYITFKTRSLTAYTTNLFIYFVVCWVVGVIMSILVEIPMLHVRDRFFPWLGGMGGKQAQRS